jgi:hypothetical protein
MYCLIVLPYFLQYLTNAKDLIFSGIPKTKFEDLTTVIMMITVS